MPDRSGLDADRLYAALDATRRTRGLQWRQVAKEAGISASTLTRMAQGKRPDVNGLAALVRWSGLDANDYLGASPSHKDALTEISVLLRGDPSLSEEQAAALTTVIRNAYELVNPARRRKSG